MSLWLQDCYLILLILFNRNIQFFWRSCKSKLKDWSGTTKQPLFSEKQVAFAGNLDIKSQSQHQIYTSAAKQPLGYLHTIKAVWFSWEPYLCKKIPNVSFHNLIYNCFYTCMIWTQKQSYNGQLNILKDSFILFIWYKTKRVSRNMQKLGQRCKC